MVILFSKTVNTYVTLRQKNQIWSSKVWVISKFLSSLLAACLSYCLQNARNAVSGNKLCNFRNFPDPPRDSRPRRLFGPSPRLIARAHGHVIYCTEENLYNRCHLILRAAYIHSDMHLLKHSQITHFFPKIVKSQKIASLVRYLSSLSFQFLQYLRFFEKFAIACKRGHLVWSR